MPGNNGSMATHVALLRGINLGGKNKVAMADLRALVNSTFPLWMYVTTSACPRWLAP